MRILCIPVCWLLVRQGQYQGLDYHLKPVMSWVRVQCIDSPTRYYAPSFSTPPSLEGFDVLFSHPSMKIRALHCFPVGPAIADDERVEAPREVIVLFDQVELGGKLGTASIAIGDSQGSEGSLRLLMELVVAVLKGSDSEGVQVLLDAITTLPPTPFSTERDVVEDDGLLRLKDIAAGGSSERPLKNRGFLDRLCPRNTPPDVFSIKDVTTRRLGSGTLSSPIIGPSASLAPDHDDPDLMLIPSYDEALRRRSSLYFVEQNVVPLSLLACRVCSSSSSDKVYPHVCCESGLLSNDASGKLRKSPYWCYLAASAAATTSTTLATMQSMLTAACPQYEALFQRDMWSTKTEKGQARMVLHPLAAAYSPSGLLFTSALFAATLTHTEELLWAALAVDRLCRGTGRPHSPAAVLRVVRFPWRLQRVQRVVDVCVVTIGDALSLLVAFPRTNGAVESPMLPPFLTYINGLRAPGQPTPGVELVHLCTHSTQPYTGTYLRAIHSLTEIQVRRANWSHGFPSPRPLPPDARLREQSTPKVQPPTGSTAPPAAGAEAVSGGNAGSPKQKGLHRLLCCVPLNVHKGRHRAQTQIPAAPVAAVPLSGPQAATDAALVAKAVPLPVALGTPVRRAVVSSPFPDQPLLTLCYVAGVVSQAEMECYRPVDSLGVHSMFWLMRGGARQRPAYGLGFYRPRLQDSERDCGGHEDREIVHDPTRTLAALGLGPWEWEVGSGFIPGEAVRYQSLLVPPGMLSEEVPRAWLQCGRADVVLQRYQAWHASEEGGRSSSEESEGCNVEEDEDVLTSMYLAYPFESSSAKAHLHMEEVITVERDHTELTPTILKVLGDRSTSCMGPSSEAKPLFNGVVQCQRAAQALLRSMVS